MSTTCNGQGLAAGAPGCLPGDGKPGPEPRRCGLRVARVRTTLRSQLAAVGVDVEATAPVRVTFAVHCDDDQECRFAALHLRTADAASAAVRRHARRWPEHQCRIRATLQVPVAGIVDVAPPARHAGLIAPRTPAARGGWGVP